MGHFPRSCTLPVSVCGAVGARREDVKGQDKLADVWVPVWERVGETERVKERDTIKSTSIKSGLVTVQHTQLTVWKLCCAFFSPRLFWSRGSLLTRLAFPVCMSKRWRTLTLNTIFTRFYVFFWLTSFHLNFILAPCRRRPWEMVRKQTAQI